MKYCLVFYQVTLRDFCVIEDIQETRTADGSSGFLFPRLPLKFISIKVAYFLRLQFNCRFLESCIARCWLTVSHIFKLMGLINNNRKCLYKLMMIILMNISWSIKLCAYIILFLNLILEKILYYLTRIITYTMISIMDMCNYISFVSWIIVDMCDYISFISWILYHNSMFVYAL